MLPPLAHAPTAAVGAARLRGDSVAGAVRDGSIFGQRKWISPQIWWRNSAPGVDLLAFFAPNPLNPLVRLALYDWFASLPGGFNENVASVPWVALVTIVGRRCGRDSAAQGLGRLHGHLRVSRAGAVRRRSRSS